MSENSSGYSPSEYSADSGISVTEKIVESTAPEHVYSAPQEINGKTVIACSEIFTVMGAGGGDSADGSGSGGGGAAFARPVAVISVDEDGVEITPVIDSTKLWIAFISAFASIMLMSIRIRRFKS